MKSNELRRQTVFPRAIFVPKFRLAVKRCLTKLKKSLGGRCIKLANASHKFVTNKLICRSIEMRLFNSCSTSRASNNYRSNYSFHIIQENEDIRHNWSYTILES